jgi:hypothetical protein
LCLFWYVQPYRNKPFLSLSIGTLLKKDVLYYRLKFLSTHANRRTTSKNTITAP